MLLETLSQSLRKARLVNETTTGAYRSIIPTITEPSGTGTSATNASIIELCSPGSGGQMTQNLLLILPYCVGNDNVTFSVRVIGWRFIPKDSVGPGLWIPVNLGEFACTGSAVVGIAGYTILSSERFADTITETKGSTAGLAAAENIISTANDTIASILLDLRGFQKVELAFDRGGSATSCNALLALI